jgi:hypothetical protein
MPLLSLPTGRFRLLSLLFAVFASIMVISAITKGYRRVSAQSLWDLPQGMDVWDYIQKYRPSGLRRVSWGALKGRGRKASMRDNLREDKNYLTKFEYPGG